MPFFSQIAGRPVLDARGDSQGKIADLVVSADTDYPVIKAVAVRGGRRNETILVPWEQVLNFDSTVGAFASIATRLPHMSPRPMRYMSAARFSIDRSWM